MVPLHLFLKATPFAAWATPVAVTLGVTVTLASDAELGVEDTTSGTPSALQPLAARTPNAMIPIVDEIRSFRIAISFFPLFPSPCLL